MKILQELYEISEIKEKFNLYKIFETHVIVHNIHLSCVLKTPDMHIFQLIAPR